MTLKPLEVKTANIATYAVTESRIAKNAVTIDKLADGAVTEVKLKDGAVGTSKLKDKSVTGAKIADATISQDKLILPIVVPSPITRPIAPPIETAEIKDGAIVRSKIAVNAVETDNIKDLNVTGGKLAPSAVTQAKIADGSVTPAKLSFVPVARPLVPPIVANEIATDAIETAKLKDGNVTTPKIADGSVIPAKASVGFGRYVPRSAAVWDLQSANFTRDGNWHVDGMDLSSIVPVGAIAIALQIEYAQTTSDSYLIFRQNDTRLPIRLNNQVGIQINSFNVIMPIDADRLIDYAVNDSLDVVIGVVVLGWFI
jgi:hypothetical protein